MKKDNQDNAVIREKIRKGLDLTFKKLLKSKRQTDGTFVFSENGVIKKVKAVDMPD
jgi:hypothetical protein